MFAAPPTTAWKSLCLWVMQVSARYWVNSCLWTEVRCGKHSHSTPLSKDNILGTFRSGWIENNKSPDGFNKPKPSKKKKTKLDDQQWKDDVFVVQEGALLFALTDRPAVGRCLWRSQLRGSRQARGSRRPWRTWQHRTQTPDGSSGAHHRTLARRSDS